MGGQVPDKLTHNTWLRRMDQNKKTRHLVDEALGPGRAKLFRQGVPMHKFVHRNNRVMTVREIAKREGLEPPTRARRTG
jgi:hypothetical protein